MATIENAHYSGVKITFQVAPLVLTQVQDVRRSSRMTVGSLFNALVFAALGILAFGGALLLLNRMLPGNLWQEAVKNQNLAAAVVFGAIVLALGWIVAAAVH